MFSTAADLKLTRILANSKLEHYIYIELAKIEELKDVNNGINTKTKVKLT